MCRDRPLCPLNGKHCLTRAEAKDRARAMRGRSVLLFDRRLEVYKCPVWRSHPDQQRLFHIGHGRPSRRRARR